MARIFLCASAVCGLGSLTRLTPDLSTNNLPNTVATGLDYLQAVQLDVSGMSPIPFLVENGCKQNTRDLQKLLEIGG